ncbi:hypothetical protein BASA83_011980 [Batrachochytrium salamandrivorans]|nr:hypothetical protein BASA83_011980 [Batrachochytrium salamandrivorans]
MKSLEDIVSSLSARLKLLEDENETLKFDAQKSRAIANRAILDHTITNSAHISLLEPKASLPDKFDGTRRNFRGFINQLELVFQLQASRYDTDRKKIAMLGTLLNGNALSWYNPYLEKPDIFHTIFQLGQDLRRSFARHSEKSIRKQSPSPDFLTADIEWNDSALRSQFYHGLSSEIKDALVHFDNPASVSAAMDLAIRIDNRLFERRQEQRLSFQRPSFGMLQQLQLHLILEISSSNKDYLNQTNCKSKPVKLLSSTHLLLDPFGNQTITWISTLYEEAHYLQWSNTIE